MSNRGMFGSSVGYGCPYCSGRGCARCQRGASALGSCTSCAQAQQTQLPFQIIEPHALSGGAGTNTQRRPDELQAVGWFMLGAGVGWSASAYSTGRTTDTPQLLAAWGGGSTALLLLGLRRFTWGEGEALWPSLLGLAMISTGFLLGETGRRSTALRTATAARPAVTLPRTSAA